MPALIAIATVEPLSVTELATRLGLGLSTTSAIVGDLSRAGLVERAEDETDRRRTMVRLPESHREAIGTWVVRARAPLRSTLERLSPGARRSFMEGWRILHEEATRGDAGEI
jgi:DNA-binding MarR family transcriptional regulator